jgi:hypothetical protein
MRWLHYAGQLAVILSIVAIVLAARSDDANKRMWTIGSAVILVAGLVFSYLTGSSCKLFTTGKVFQAPSVNSIVKWAFACALISIVVLIVTYLFGNKKDKGVTLSHYGIVAKGESVLAAFVTAVVVVVIGYVIVFVVDAIFKTDFRFWTFAFKTFEASAIPAALKYMPFFFVYYFVAGAAAVANTNSEKLQGVLGYVIASLTNMGGILLWLILQYGKLFATGHAFYPSQALSGILLFALVPTLILASCYTKYIYKKTGNIYTAAFLNAILLTLMTVANTAVYWQ